VIESPAHKKATGEHTRGWLVISQDQATGMLKEPN
jgi:hypothetical protein